ncbi:MAG: FAD-dependent oxidoreductase [Solirubrobacterales bacterium]|nr:FAD-dependent oxidoreductase [Solirubrobacterales bacterium]
MSERLPPNPRERINRARTINFSFDGKDVEAYDGDTIGSALHASGQKVLSRSFKYHRPRGLLCCAGQCPNCLVDVDGSPGVRACTEPVRAGIKVTHMNAKPSLDFDVMRATDLFGKPFTPPGFYYKTFIRPRRLWPLYEKVLRNAAGLGRLAKRQADREWRTEYRRRRADVLVVGGGVAGMAAALRAAELGADVVLMDDGPELGGAMLAGQDADSAKELAESIRAAGVEVLAPAAALGFFDGLVPAWQGNTLHQVRADRHIAATGSIEQPLIFDGNDLPGVMLCSGAERLASLYGVRPGETAVVATTTDRGLESALALQEAGIEVAGVVDARAGDGSEELLGALAAAGISVHRGTGVVKAFGRKHVRGVVVADLDDEGRPDPASKRGIDCDLVAVSGGTMPATSLLLQAGAKARWDEASGSYLPDGVPSDIRVAGAVAGHEPRNCAAKSGAVAGAEAALSLGLGSEEDRARLQADRASLLRETEGPAPAGQARTQDAGSRNGKCFACLCEDVTTKDIDYAIEEGFDSLELLKRYTTVTMGPCQGRMCQLASIRQMSEDTGASIEEVGLTTARPPWSTVPMGVLAGRPFEPAKRSAVHGRHRELGGNVMWAGDWRRAYDYGDVRAETMAVHEGAGLIDVSTLGKLVVSGPEAGAFLNLLYPNRFDNLKPGRIRYGVLGDDAGRITDDGTICRLDENSFYVTTTSSGADAVESWFSWWLAEWKLDVQLTDVSQGLSAFNLAGPRSREILSGLTELDCSNDSFAYLDGKRANVVGVPCLMLRIGFVGELGYELHCPGPLAEHLWDSLLEAGAAHEIRPFGLEPQRILRLQKMHILVGQDTDAESNPLEAAMPWIVKFEKEEDFIGRWALEAVAERGAENKLIGFTIENGTVPTEGAAVVVDGQPVGLVTSSRFSPKLERSIGMAWVPAALAEDGTTITVSDEGRQISAAVQTAPFYDPDQELLRG